MTDEANAISDQLLRLAVDQAEHPADAVAALLSAAGTILQRHFGAVHAAALMVDMVTSAERQLIDRSGDGSS